MKGNHQFPPIPGISTEISTNRARAIKKIKKIKKNGASYFFYVFYFFNCFLGRGADLEIINFFYFWNY